jgi:hypothetical protein
VCTKPGIGSP